MENFGVYEDIAKRTEGDIYIGVVGPVRTGKSTFIKRFMEKLVIPSADEKLRAQMIDELPQPAGGKTVMTTEPKFVPAKAAKITIRKNTSVSVRLVDCVGFAVSGANGFEENGKAREVKTPWSDEPMPFEEAAALGTQKVIADHSTIGVLVTTDGSFSGIDRLAYEDAEERTANELKKIGKPFVILLNCIDPSRVENLRISLEKKYKTTVVAMNVDKIDENGLIQVLGKVLYEFPVTSLSVCLPKWIQALPKDSKIICSLLEKMKAKTANITKMKDCIGLESSFEGDTEFEGSDDLTMDLGTGAATLSVTAKEGLYYRVLSDECGEEITDEFSLLRFVESLSESKKNYDKIKDAFLSAEEYGYGMVAPCSDDMVLEEPQLIRKGASYGVGFKASAPSYHILKIDVRSEAKPIVGNKKQGEEFVRETTSDFGDGQGKIWNTNIFGRSLKEILSDGMKSKSDAMPEEVRKKMRKTITRIVNDGKGGVICILL